MGKAVIFSLASLFIVILFVASSSLVTKFKLTESEIEITRTRVKILNSVINDFEDSYFEKLLFISSKNALIGLSKYYSESDFSSPNLKKNLELALGDVIYQGILYDRNIQVNLSEYINYEYTLKGMMENISILMDEMGLEIKELNISIPQTERIRQIDPWTIQVKGIFTYFISDKEGSVSWKGFSTKIVNISVIGMTLEDRAGHRGKVTADDWFVENNSASREPSVVQKMSGYSTDPSSTSNNGICKSGCYDIP